MESLVSQLIRLESYRTADNGEASLSVIVADDEKRIQQLLTISLKALGHEVVGVGNNGEEAVALAAEHKPDLIILDIDMPLLDGLGAAEQILKEQSLPIVISTGRTDSEALRRARTLEVAGYLVKPFTKEQLRSTLAMARAQHLTILESKVKIARLTEEIEVVKAIDDAVAMLMEKFRIDRKEALEKLQTAANARSCPLVDAARAISVSLRPREIAAA